MSTPAVAPKVPDKSSRLPMPFLIASLASIAIHYFFSSPLGLRENYSDLVVFGASYNDNAHPRLPQHQGSLKYTQFGGRYQNGPVSTEYMMQAEPFGLEPATGLNYTNYAYGGSTADNDITPSVYPGTKDQMQQFFEDLATGTVKLGESRALLYINTGINQMTKVWLEAVKAGSTEEAISAALNLVTRNSQAVEAQMRGLISGMRASYPNKIDLLIVGIPPLELTPYHQNLANHDSEKLELLEIVCLQYNHELSIASKAMKKEFNKGKSATRVNVFYYDMAGLWRRIYAAPEEFNIDPQLVMKPCYTAETQDICPDADQRVYFDGLHPVTSVQKVLTKELVQTVRRW